MNYCIIIENTQAQYFNNLTRNCTRVFSTMTINSCIKFANLNDLLLASYAEPILAFCQKNGIANKCNLLLIQALFSTIYSPFHCYIWHSLYTVLKYSRVVQLSNYITCPLASKWSKTTCPPKIYLQENWHFLISRRKHMLWVLIRSALSRHFYQNCLDWSISYSMVLVVLLLLHVHL